MRKSILKGIKNARKEDTTKKTLKSAFKDVPKEKLREILEKLRTAVDADELISKAKDYGIVLEKEPAEKLLDLLKNVAVLTDQQLAAIAGGTYLGMRVK